MTCYAVSMVDNDFGHWLAGFIDGEGCFYITRNSERNVWRARFSLSLRADDRPIIDTCRDTTDIGTVHEYKAQSGNTVARWDVQSRESCEHLRDLLHRFPLRAKKAKDFAVWERAVLLQRDIRLGSADNSQVRAGMLALKQELALVRREGIR